MFVQVMVEMALIDADRLHHPFLFVEVVDGITRQLREELFEILELDNIFSQ